MYSSQGFFYDGYSAARHEVTIQILANQQITVKFADKVQHFYWENIEIVPPIGKTQRAFILNKKARLEMDRTAELDAFLTKHSKQGWIFHMESRWRYVFLGLLVTIGVAYLGFFYGLPAGAEFVADRLPPETDALMGAQLLETLDKQEVFEKSNLSAEREKEITTLFHQMARAAKHPEYKIVFRHGDSMGANAMALPGGTVIVLDDLVVLSQEKTTENKNNINNKNQEKYDELVAVLAHEIGHLHHRHSVRQALEASVVGLVVALITGDVSGSSSVMIGVPTALLNNHYSRDMEAQSDEYAFQTLHAMGKSPLLLGNFLAKLEGESGGSDMPKFLLSHPPTPERIAAARAAEKRYAKQKIMPKNAKNST